MPQNWSVWLLESPAALVVGRVVRTLTSIGAAVASLLIVVLLVRGKPLPSLVWLLLPAIPLLAIGQVWGIATLIASNPRRPSLFRMLNPLGFFFAGLPTWKALAVVALFVLAGINGDNASSYLGDGGPRPPTRHCKYPLENHGYVTRCVSHERYLAVGAAEQRFATSAFAAFFSFQAGLSAAALARRRKAAAA